MVASPKYIVSTHAEKHIYTPLTFDYLIILFRLPQKCVIIAKLLEGNWIIDR